MGRTRVLALALVLAACSHRPPSLFGERLPSGCAGRAVGTERCFGWMRDRIVMATSFRAYPDAELARYVDAVGARVIAASGQRARGWRFRVLDDPTPQATTSLGHIIYVNRGAIAVLRDESELAGLLAHEIAHASAGHVHEAFVDAMHDSSTAATRTLADERDDEVQADELAVRFLARAGYDPRGFERTLRALATLTPPYDPEEARHPSFAVRIAHVEALAARLPATGSHDDRVLRRLLPKLVLGDDPRALAIAGRTILFSRLGLAVALAGHGEVTVSDGAAELAIADGVTVDIRIVPAMLGAVMTEDDKTPVVSRTVGDQTLLIIGSSAAAATYVHRLGKAIRAIRADERAHLQPRYVDLAKPRELWTD